jgi:hypothetical protein
VPSRTLGNQQFGTAFNGSERDEPEEQGDEQDSKAGESRVERHVCLPHEERKQKKNSGQRRGLNEMTWRNDG